MRFLNRALKLEKIDLVQLLCANLTFWHDSAFYACWMKNVAYHILVLIWLLLKQVIWYIKFCSSLSQKLSRFKTVHVLFCLVKNCLYFMAYFKQSIRSPIVQVYYFYCKDIEPFYHSFMYSLVSLLSGI